MGALAPLIIAGVGAAAGGGLQYAGAQKSRRAMEDAYGKQITQQQQYQTQGAQVVNKSAQSSGADVAKKNIATAAASREAGYNKLAGVPVNTAIAPPQQNLYATRDVSAGNLAGRSRARLASYGDWQVDQALRNMELQRQMNQISSFSKGTANIFPTQMMDAAHKGDSLAGIGKLVQLAGTLASLGYSAYGALPGAGTGVPGAPTAVGDININPANVGLV